jgi:hypothetical protein
MVQFQKLITNVFLALHGHNIHCQQLEVRKFLMRYQQFASHAYCGAVLRYQDTRMCLQCSVSFVQGLKKTHHTRIL